MTGDRVVLGLDLPLRATGDADFGVPPHVRRRPDLVDAIEALGYHKAAGNRWERRIDDRRVAAVDLLVPTYRTRARDTVTVGSVVTTEVPGLAEALRRPAINVDIELQLTDGATLSTSGGQAFARRHTAVCAPRSPNHALRPRVPFLRRHRWLARLTDATGGS